MSAAIFLACFIYQLSSDKKSHQNNRFVHIPLQFYFCFTEASLLGTYKFAIIISFL